MAAAPRPSNPVKAMRRKRAFLLYPNFEPLNLGDDDYHYVRSLRGTTESKGRTPTITDEIRSEIVKLVISGSNYGAAGRALGIKTPQIIHNSKRNYPELWDEEFKRQQGN